MATDQRINLRWWILQAWVASFSFFHSTDSFSLGWSHLGIYAWAPPHVLTPILWSAWTSVHLEPATNCTGSSASLGKNVCSTRIYLRSTIIICWLTRDKRMHARVAHREVHRSMQFHDVVCGSLDGTCATCRCTSEMNDHA